MDNEELEVWKRLNACECVKKVFVRWHEGDRYTYNEFSLIMSKNEHDNTPQYPLLAIWIPPLYDPIRPERSLIGILRDNYPNTSMQYKMLSDCMTFPRPDLALARVIIAQERK